MEAGRELDVQIARAMGWQNVRQLQTRDAGLVWIGSRVALQETLGMPTRIPSFSTHIEAAWQIVEYMRSKGYEFAIISDDRSDPRDYAVEFIERSSNIGETTYLWGERSESAPHAICLEFLRVS